MSKEALINLRKDLFAVEKKLFEDGLKDIMKAFRELPQNLKEVVMLHSSVGKAIRVFDEDEMNQVIWFNFHLDKKINFFSSFNLEEMNDELPKEKKLTASQMQKAKPIQEKIKLLIKELEDIPFSGINKLTAIVCAERITIKI